MTGISFDARPEFASEGLEFEPEDGRPPVAPGKRALTMDFAPRSGRLRGEAGARDAGGAEAAARPAPNMDDAFGLHVDQAGRPARGEVGESATGLGADHADLEQAFGVSLSGVALHIGGAAHEATAQRGVRAFALGDQIALPAAIPAAERRVILAHEVAHVVP